jgi:hypothetical protein
LNEILRSLRAVWRHVPPVALFALLTVLFTRPLATLVTSGVIGAAPADNMSALWNIWWARTAIRGPDPFFWTPALFAPLGTSLALHSFAPLESAVAAWLPVDSVMTLYNGALLATVFLNFTCAYAAAVAITGDRLSSVFAGIAFGGAPFLLVRLEGHLNVLSAWGLPLLLIAVVRLERRPSWTTALAVSGALGLLAYSDYYFAIFGAVMVAAHLTVSRSSIVIRATPMTRERRRAVAVLGGLAAFVCAVAVWIELTGGADTTIAGIRLRMTESFNERVTLGFLIVAAWWVWKRPSVSVRELSVERHPTPTHIGVIVAAMAVLVAPILAAGIRLWLAGDYESQVYFWRSAPPGIDVATFVLGNPLSSITGRWTTAALARFGIDRIEGTAWMGVVPMILVAVAIRRLRSRPDVRPYLAIGGLFLVWALGPYLRLFGRNTGFMLPQTLLHFLPIVANARIPGRAFVVVQLMTAILGALALASLAPSTRTIVATLAAALLIIDYHPSPRPWTPIDRPAIYDTLSRQPPGVVLEIPLGVRDGFGHRGALDHRVLYYQTIHGHPQMGGFVARLSGRVKSAYETDPVVGPLLDLSEGKSVSVSTAASTCVLTCDVRYVVIDESTASRELQAFAVRSFSLQPIGRSGPRALYSVQSR